MYHNGKKDLQMQTVVLLPYTNYSGRVILCHYHSRILLNAPPRCMSLHDIFIMMGISSITIQCLIMSYSNHVIHKFVHTNMQDDNSFISVFT